MKTQWVILTPAYEEQVEGEPTRCSPPRTICAVSVHEALLTAWQQLAETQGGVLVQIELQSLPSMWLDMGGMCKIDRKIYDLQIAPGLAYTIPAQDVEAYLGHIDDREGRAPEEIGGTPYRTLSSMHAGVCLTMEQFATVKRQLQEIATEAAAFASAENNEFNEKITVCANVKAPKRPVGPMGDA